MCRPTGYSGRKANALKALLPDRLGSCFKELEGVLSVWRKKEVKTLWKRLSPFRQPSGAPQSPHVVPTRSGTQQTLSDVCRKQQCPQKVVSTHPWDFQTPDSPQSKPRVGWWLVGEGGKAFIPKTASHPSLLQRKGPEFVQAYKQAEMSQLWRQLSYWRMSISRGPMEVSISPATPLLEDFQTCHWMEPQQPRPGSPQWGPKGNVNWSLDFTSSLGEGGHTHVN